MKKLSLFFALVLIVTMVCPFSALAEEIEPVLTYDELINLSCSAFPEYEDNIRNPQINPVRAYSLEDPVVISESRAISENETATYQELASGLAFLSFTKTWDELSSSTSGNVKTVTAALYVYCSLSPEVFANWKFVYKINSAGYDSIVECDNYGKEFTTCNVTHGHTSAYSKMTENASGDAFARYDLLFYPDDYSMLTPSSCRVDIAVGGDNLKLTVNGKTYTNP